MEWVLVGETTTSAPTGLRDSKLLSAAARERLVPRIARWAPTHAVGHASCTEIDEWGLTAALRLAGMRALAQCPTPDIAILDGSHDWLTNGTDALFEVVPWPQVVLPAVQMQVKADLTCSSVAAASVLAKVARDRIMVELGAGDQRYGWGVNKGYTTPEHAAGIREHGMSEWHRRSWDIAAAVDLRDHPGPIVVPSVATQARIPN